MQFVVPGMKVDPTVMTCVQQPIDYPVSIHFKYVTCAIMRVSADLEVSSCKAHKPREGSILAHMRAVWVSIEAYPESSQP